MPSTPSALGWPTANPTTSTAVTGQSVRRSVTGVGWPVTGGLDDDVPSADSSRIDATDSAARTGREVGTPEGVPEMVVSPEEIEFGQEIQPAQEVEPAQETEHTLEIEMADEQLAVPARESRAPEERDLSPADSSARAALPAATAQAFPDLPPPADTRVVAVANQKGGVGKTTSAVNLAAALALRGARVLIIDLDPQGNASTALGVDHTVGVPSIYDVLIGGKSLADVVQPAADVPRLFAAPATIDLAGAEIELVSLVARETRLDRAVQNFLREGAGQEGFDYVLIDCPPSLGLLTLNALVAAREVCIPIQCEYYALEGLGQLLRNIEMIQSHLNPSLAVSSILLTMYDGRTRLASQVADEVRAHFDAAVLPTAIPRSVRISEAPSHGQTVLTYDPASSGAWCYLQAAGEFAARLPQPSDEH